MSITTAQRGIKEPWQIQFAQSGTGINITGMNVYLYVKNQLSDTDAEAIYTDSFLTGTHSSPTTGWTALKYESAAHTASVPKGIYWYEFRLFDTDNEPFKNVIGQIEYKDTVMDKITE